MDTQLRNKEKEQHILRHVRKTLSNIVKEVSPPGGQGNPLTSSTIEEIMSCFDLIAEREKELDGKIVIEKAKPQIAASPQTGSNGVSFVKLSKIKR